MDGGAWWALVHGVPKSQTRLKRLSSPHSPSPTLTPTGNHQVCLFFQGDSVWPGPGQHVCVHMCSIMSNSFAIPWTIAHQASLSVEFPGKEYWNGLPLPTPGDLPDPGIEPTSLVSPALASGFFTPSATREAPCGESQREG